MLDCCLHFCVVMKQRYFFFSLTWRLENAFQPPTPTAATQRHRWTCRPLGCYIVMYNIIYYIQQASKQRGRSSSPRPFFLKSHKEAAVEMTCPCCTVCYFSSCAATPQREFWEAIYTKDKSYWPSFLTSEQDTSLTISHSHLQNLPSAAGEREQTYEFLKSSAAYLSCKGLDILHFCLFRGGGGVYLLFFFFLSEGTMFLGKKKLWHETHSSFSLSTFNNGCSYRPVR